MGAWKAVNGEANDIVACVISDLKRIFHTLQSSAVILCRRGRFSDGLLISADGIPRNVDAPSPFEQFLGNVGGLPVHVGPEVGFQNAAIEGLRYEHERKCQAISSREKAPSKLTPSQRRRLIEIEEIAGIISMDHWNIVDYPSDSRGTYLDIMKNRLIRGDLIIKYALIVEFLTVIICHFYFGRNPGVVILPGAMMTLMDRNPEKWQKNKKSYI